MQRTTAIVAFFFACIDCFSQISSPGGLYESAGQYPFVYYTPKQGLVSSRVRNIRQDSKGRMLFITYGGLSIYDGARFANYRQEDGLAYELVNDVIEITPDSFLVATNAERLNTLVNGHVGEFKTIDGFYPTVNHFLKSNDGNLYAAADEGLFVLQGRKFVRISLRDSTGSEIGRNFETILEWKNLIFLIPWSAVKERLIVFDKQTKKLLTISYDINVHNVTPDQQGQLWISHTDGLKLLDTNEILRGKIRLLDLAPAYSLISHISNPLIFFDHNNDIWLNIAGQVKIFSLGSPQKLIPFGDNLKAFSMSNIMQDREGTIWLATDGAGVIKIAGTNVQILNGFIQGQTGLISTIQQQGDTIWFFSPTDHSIVEYVKNQIKIFPTREATRIFSMYAYKKSIYLVSSHKIFWIPDKNDDKLYLNPQVIFEDSTIVLGSGVIDPGGAIISHIQNDTAQYLLVFKDNKELTRYRISAVGDQPALDNAGRLWVITRQNHLMVFSLHPEQPGQYLQLLKDFTNQLPHINQRSIVVDKNNNVWVGTRNSGLFYLRFDSLKFRSATQFTTKNGLTDNFVSSLNCDNDNVLWVGTETGLDKIFQRNGQYIFGNVSKSNNFFQAITRIAISKDKTVWALTNEGTLLRISNQSSSIPAAAPPSLLASLKINGQTQDELSNRLSYWENNLTFYVAAPSFVDEKSIQYRYMLKGSGNDQWSEPSNNSVFNFINLPPGKYDLQIRSDFPEAMYAPQIFSYTFVINPPWWKTWWFRIAFALIVASLLIFSFRFYYQRKLEKQRAILEKQQAVEQERTRIAADMHDDLGAGLTKIRFITENILEKTESGETVQPELEKLKNFSSELLESMGEIIWATSEKNNLLSNTLYYLRSYAVNYCEENNIECHFSIPENFKDRVVSGNTRRNLFLLLKESLHNIVKHASAKTVCIEANVKDKFQLIIKDDGKGFTETGAAGNGLINMKKRVRELNGAIQFENNAGTTITIQLPFAPNQSTIG